MNGIKVGQVWRSKDKRDNGRLVTVLSVAERLLKAAVRRAVEDFYAVVFQERSASLTIGYKSPTVHAAVVTMLAEAGRSAELLLSERAS